MSQIISLPGNRSLEDLFVHNLTGIKISADHIINLYQNPNITGKNIYYGNLNTFTRIILVLLLRVGFMLVQIGSIPTECVYTMALKNVLDMVLSIVSFSFIGSMFAFGKDVAGIIGTGSFINNLKSELDLVMHGVCACILGNAISSTLTGDRLHVACLVFMSVFNSALFTPLMIHQAWHPDGWMAKNRIMNTRVSLKDYGGALVIHCSSGIGGAVGALVLGRRLIKLSSIHECSITSSSAAIVPFAYFLQMTGLMSITLLLPAYETLHAPQNYVSLIISNQLLAISGGLLSVLLILLLLCTKTFDYWKVLRLIEGGVAGMVCVAPGVDIYSPVTCFLIAFVYGIIFYFSLVFIFRTSIEDYCNIIVTHAVSGIIAPLLPPLFASGENLGFTVTFRTRTIHFVWQLICVLTVIGVTTVVYLILFLTFKLVRLLRNKSEEENHARSRAVTGPSFREIVRDIRKTVHTEPVFEPGFSAKAQQTGKFRILGSKIPKRNLENLAYDDFHWVQSDEKYTGPCTTARTEDSAVNITDRAKNLGQKLFVTKSFTT